MAPVAESNHPPSTPGSRVRALAGVWLKLLSLWGVECGASDVDIESLKPCKRLTWVVNYLHSSHLKPIPDPDASPTPVASSVSTAARRRFALALLGQGSGQRFLFQDEELIRLCSCSYRNPGRHSSINS